MFVDWPAQKELDWAVMVLFRGKGLTVTVMLLVEEQPVALIVSVKVYVVFTVGEAIGFEMVLLLSPVAGDQL